MKLKIVASKLAIYTDHTGRLHVVVQPVPVVPEDARDALVVHIGNGYVELPEKATDLEWRFDDAGEAPGTGVAETEAAATTDFEQTSY